MLFHFGRDVNINWKHGVIPLPKEEYSGKGRISIIMWGQLKNCIEEPGSPGYLNDPTEAEKLDDLEETTAKQGLSPEEAVNAL